MPKTKTRVFVLSDLTDCVWSLEDFAQRCESFAKRARALAEAGFDLVRKETNDQELAVRGDDQDLADELGLAE